MNSLYYGDNLDILRKHVKDESVDLIYLDPPFNSKRAYNVIFQDKTGLDSAAQIQAFEDSWTWTEETQKAFDEIMSGAYPAQLQNMMQAFREFMGINNLMAYLTMMAIRLVELHRVLKKTGSIYLHCDPTASHYLKILMDQIFGITLFNNEIIWKRSTAHSDFIQGAKHFGRLHDILLYYTKTDKYKWNQLYQPYDQTYIEKIYKYVDKDTGKRYTLDNIAGPGGAAKGNPKYEIMGISRYWRFSKEKMQHLISEGRIVQQKPGNVPRYKRYLDEMPGNSLQDIWMDINPISSFAKERLGYPTQKPITLLERIIQTSSNEGDVVLDPFCGCGTAIAAAEKLNRNWIGIDVTHLAIALIKKRMADHFPDSKFEVIGEPKSVYDAEQLFKQSPFQFEAWAVSLLSGQPYKSKGGGDKGVDGLLFFKDGKSNYQKIIISVKGGAYQPKDVRELKAVLERDKAPMGIIIALKPPTKGMLSEAAAMGKWKIPGVDLEFPVMQIVTIKELFEGKKPDLPQWHETLKRANREIREKEKTLKLL
ncbi:site-specific DNA-methyltransferase [candidate division LCP-89 bacterium B3_LCP]|uniref:Site-specific DNA-methyltransferase n=1 Tax=candidate division LCP-89 bacterium B3_LCP TaxID=2012998 RepID=A0A532V5M0_UNCL8|nr:MAG: site-specific DNA-methyltransferase [candidate division LCP-89 bacterium B3_LCP]